MTNEGMEEFGSQEMEDRGMMPEEIFDEFRTQPPLMRDEAKAVYLGNDVDWVLNLVNGWVERSGYARLALKQQRNIVQFVSATVPISDCPWLRHVHAGELLRVRGHIADVGTMSIELEGASVSHVVAEAAQ